MKENSERVHSSDELREDRKADAYTADQIKAFAKEFARDVFNEHYGNGDMSFQERIDSSVDSIFNNTKVFIKSSNNVSTKPHGRKGKQYNLESWMISNGRSGEVFYSEKMDRHLTAISTHHKRKIKTERLVIITTYKRKPVASQLTKVTIL